MYVVLYSPPSQTDRTDGHTAELWKHVPFDSVLLNCYCGHNSHKTVLYNGLQRIYNNKFKTLVLVPRTLVTAHLASCLTLTGSCVA